MEKILEDLNNLNIDLNWYLEDSHYQQIIDSQFSAIIERVKLFFLKQGKEDFGTKIERAVNSIENISGQVSYLSNALEGELNEKEKPSLSPSERLGIISDIAYHLQETMVTSEINAYLGAFGVVTDDVSIVPSKRVYVQDLLKTVPAEKIVEISSDLKLQKTEGMVCSKAFEQLIKDKDLSSITADFERAIKNIESDPDQAIASSSSTLESICKSILEMEGTTLPKKQNISNLLSQTASVLKFSPNDHDNQEIKRVLGGIQNVILGIGALRTGYSSAHGHGIKRYNLKVRHVRMLVNSMVTYGTFMLETYMEQTNGE